MARWPDDDEHDARIDAAIDDAARQMTAGAPGGELKARVLARLDERAPLSFGPRLLWTMASIAAAVIIVAVVVVGRLGDREGHRTDRTDTGATQPQSAASATQQPESAAPPGAIEPRTPAAAVVRPDTAHDGDSVQLRATAARAPRAAPSEVDALAPDALDVDSIRLAPLPQASSIRVAPLEPIDPIDVAPLATPDSDESSRREP